MTDGNKIDCSKCNSKDIKIDSLTTSNESLSKQVKDLVVKKEFMTKNLDEIKKEKKELSETLKAQETDAYFRSIKGKTDRTDDFKKLAGDVDFKQ